MNTGKKRGLCHRSKLHKPIHIQLDNRIIPQDGGKVNVYEDK